MNPHYTRLQPLIWRRERAYSLPVGILSQSRYHLDCLNLMVQELRPKKIYTAFSRSIFIITLINLHFHRSLTVLSLTCKVHFH